MQLYVHIISQVGEVKAKSTFKKKQKSLKSKSLLKQSLKLKQSLQKFYISAQLNLINQTTRFDQLIRG